MEQSLGIFFIKFVKVLFFLFHLKLESIILPSVLYWPYHLWNPFQALNNWGLALQVFCQLYGSLNSALYTLFFPRELLQSLFFHLNINTLWCSGMCDCLGSLFDAILNFTILGTQCNCSCKQLWELQLVRYKKSFGGIRVSGWMYRTSRKEILICAMS